jgi:hypothetical protein
MLCVTDVSRRGRQAEKPSNHNGFSLYIVVEHEPLSPGSDQRPNSKGASDLGKHITVSNPSSRRSSASRGHFADMGPLLPTDHSNS